MIELATIAQMVAVISACWAIIAGVGAGASMGANLGSMISLSGKSETSETPNSQSAEERLATLKSLLDKGLISQDEFTEKRKKIIEAI